jgi:uroporphyrinogen III methyltransferase/synthase
VFLSAHEGSEEQQTSKDIQIPQAETIVFLMGLSKLNTIVRSLVNAGWNKNKPIIIISNGTRPNQKVVKGTLFDIEKLAFSHPLEAPALIIAGDTVNFYQPQAQKIFLHCGTNPEKYTHCGQIIPWPMIQIQDIVLSTQEKQNLIKDFDQSDFVILTSPNAVEHFMRTILSLKSANALLQKIFMVIGRSTAEVLDEFGISAQIISSQETAEGLFNIIMRVVNLEGKTILLPRSSLPNPFLKEALEQKGAHVKEWTIYNNIKPIKRLLPDFNLDGVIFTSPSTFRNFIEDYGRIPPSWQILAKGPVTAKALQKEGYQPHTVGI